MKQFHFNYQNIALLRKELQKIKMWSSSAMTSHIVFQILTDILDKKTIGAICSEIEKELPEAEYFGCSTNGNIINGAFDGTPVSIVCTLFEYPSTKTEFFQYELTAETSDFVAEDLLLKISERPWIKAVELLTTIRGMSMTGFCEKLGKSSPDIQIFGGGAFNGQVDSDDACVFSKQGGWLERGVVFMLVGGNDFYVTSTYITGWKPLGKYLRVTKAKGNILYELDGEPAYSVYYKYLNICNDLHFFANSLEFPFFYEHNGISLLRAPSSSNADGSLTMTSDIEENVTARLAYGDPWTILDSVKHEGQKIADFCPEIIQIFSCAARRTFWGISEISKESMPFQNVAPTSGFYTSGEFLRTDGFVNQHNVTLVVAGMREGEPINKPVKMEVDTEDFAGSVSLISRLANYINAAFHELEFIALRDGMTKLFNRSEIQRIITERLESGKPMSLVMLDIDNFKSVNDTFGHKEGDNVIIGLASLLKSTAVKQNGSAGRWGGEEFMLFLPYELETAEKTAGEICKGFSDICFEKAGHNTVSIGVTQAIPDESVDTLLLRVDTALYEAKHTGKNRYVVK